MWESLIDKEGKCIILELAGVALEGARFTKPILAITELSADEVLQ